MACAVQAAAGAAACARAAVTAAGGWLCHCLVAWCVDAACMHKQHTHISVCCRASQVRQSGSESVIDFAPNLKESPWGISHALLVGCGKISPTSCLTLFLSVGCTEPCMHGRLIVCIMVVVEGFCAAHVDRACAARVQEEAGLEGWPSYVCSCASTLCSLHVEPLAVATYTKSCGLGQVQAAVRQEGAWPVLPLVFVCCAAAALFPRTCSQVITPTWVFGPLFRVWRLASTSVCWPVCKSMDVCVCVCVCQREHGCVRVLMVVSRCPPLGQQQHNWISKHALAGD